VVGIYYKREEIKFSPHQRHHLTHLWISHLLLKEKEESVRWIKHLFIFYNNMQPKINLQKCFISFLSGIGAGFVFVELIKSIDPHISWGSDLCKICDLYECTTYNDLCDYCADDVREELNNEDEENNGTEC